MSELLIRKFRQKRNVAQLRLATQCKIGQLQLKRLEAGISPIRLETAVRICNALDLPMQKVFPKLATVCRKYPDDAIQTDEAITALTEAGFEVDGVAWTAEFALTNDTCHHFSLSSIDKNRFRDVLLDSDDGESEPPNSFFSFNSELYCVCVNLKALRYIRFLFDGPSFEDMEPLSYGKVIQKSPKIKVWSTVQDSCLEFKVDADEKKERCRDEGQLYNLLIGLDVGYEQSFVSFEDSDGEEVYLRVRDIAMIAVPHWVLNPEMLDESDPGDDEDSEEIASGSESGDPPAK